MKEIIGTKRDTHDSFPYDPLSINNRQSRNY